MIKVAEIFGSLQGEGRFTGTPSVFLRTFGCNFRCRNFNVPKGKEVEGVNPDVAKVIKNIALYDSVADLPLVNTGCDSYMSIYPEFKNFHPMMTVEAIQEKVMLLVPGNEFSRTKHLVITGGEPLLGWQKQYPALLKLLENENNLTNLTFETNGTQALHQDFIDFSMDESKCNMHFSVSAKLPNSGEHWLDAIKPEIVETYSYHGIVDLKFVVDNVDDISHIKKAMKEFEGSYNGDVYLMPQGGTRGTYQKNARDVAEIAMSLGVNYSPRLQCDLFENGWGT